MTVYVAMINDRHADPEPTVFTTAEAAIAFARQKAIDYAHDPADVEYDDIPGWLFHARYSVEGDSVWVIAKEVGP
jgi:formylmethanofuran dehydrogenase subunit E-like metal-binding protein